MSQQQQIDALKYWIQCTFERARHGMLLPISGGSDSALCMWLLHQVFPGKTLAVHYGAKTKMRCRNWFESIGEIRYERPVRAKLVSSVEPLRWAKILALSLAEKRWLVASRNRTEEAFGTYSLASRIAPYLPLAGVWKSEVMQLCKYINVPEEITASSRRADPDCGRPAELSEISLENVDLFLQSKSSGTPAQLPMTETQITYLEEIYRYNAFKRNFPQKGTLLT